MTTTRAKFRCTMENTKVWSRADASAPSRVYEFYAAYDDGTPENERFAKTTPSGKIEITVDNPAVVLEPGKDYYVDFTPVEDINPTASV